MEGQYVVVKDYRNRQYTWEHREFVCVHNVVNEKTHLASASTIRFLASDLVNYAVALDTKLREWEEYSKKLYELYQPRGDKLDGFRRTKTR